MKNENKALFTACHSLTKNLVTGTNYNYHCTFSACLRLYYNNFNMFVVACAKNFVDVVAISNNHFEKLPLVESIEKMDFDRAAEKTVKDAINFAFAYGISKRGADISKLQVYHYKKGYTLPMDTAAPEIVRGMKQNDQEDIKQDIFLYLFKRSHNPDFIALPDVIKLMRAGDAVITSYYNRIVTQCKNNAFSMDAANAPDVSTSDAYSSLKTDEIIQSLVNNVPAKHREAARQIIAIRYLNGRKEATIAETAEKIGLSLRTVKTILKEMTQGLSIGDFV